MVPYTHTFLSRSSISVIIPTLDTVVQHGRGDDAELFGSALQSDHAVRRRRR